MQKYDVLFVVRHVLLYVMRGVKRFFFFWNVRETIRGIFITSRNICHQV